MKALAGAALAGSSLGSHAVVFAINEGVTYRVTNEEIANRYAAIATDLGRLLKEPVTIEPVASYPALRKGLAARTYDLALVHPAHLSIQAIKSSGYSLVAITKGFEAYRAQFLVKSDSPLRTLADLRDHKVGVPDEDSITAWMVRATLRDALGSPNLVTYLHTRYQDAVPFMVDNHFAAAGATAATAVIRTWESRGGKVLAKTRPVPIKHVIASDRLTADQVQRVRDYLLTLDSTEEGRRKLEATRYRGFAPFSQDELLTIGRWLGL